MKYISEKLTRYIIKTGVVSEESYAVYQYGFQIGFEMLCCFIVCLGIALYMHMIPDFVLFTVIFILLRTYAGGVHMNSFAACLACSALVQTFVLLVNAKYEVPIMYGWIVIILSSVLLIKLAPVENINRELDNDEKKHCKKITIKIIIGVIIFAGCCTLGDITKAVQLVALTILTVFISQCIGIIKYNIEKNKIKNDNRIYTE